MLKVGIIGAGFIGKAHAQAYKTIKGAELVGIAEAQESLGQEFAEEYECQYYKNAEDMISDKEIDIVDICLPTFLHEEFVIMAARHGKHILCEKPFTLTLESADRMIEEVKKANVKLMVAQVVRFWPEYVKIKEYYDAGNIGKASVVYANRLAQHPNWSDWFKDPERSGGGLFDLHLHDIDYLRYLLGPVESLYAVGEKNHYGAWNHVVTTLNFKNGVKAYAEGVYEMTDEYPFTMTLRAKGSEGTLDFQFAAGFNLDDAEGAKSGLVYYKNGTMPQIIEVEQKDPYANEIQYFVDCVAEGREPEIIHPDESREVLSIILAIQESLKTGKVQII